MGIAHIFPAYQQIVTILAQSDASDIVNGHACDREQRAAREVFPSRQPGAAVKLTRAVVRDVEGLVPSTGLPRRANHERGVEGPPHIADHPGQGLPAGGGGKIVRRRQHTELGDRSHGGARAATVDVNDRGISPRLLIDRSHSEIQAVARDGWRSEGHRGEEGRAEERAHGHEGHKKLLHDFFLPSELSGCRSLT